MTDVMHIGDALCDRALRVQDTQRLQDVTAGPHPPGRQNEVFLVFDEIDRYLGFVVAREAALFPNRIFADLIKRRQTNPLRLDAPIDEALSHLDQEKSDFAPVTDEHSKVVGVISRFSLFAALLLHERELVGDRSRLIGLLQGEVTHHQIAATVFDSTSEGILVTDSNGIIQLVNSAFTKTTGYNLDEVSGKTPNILASGKQDKTFYAQMWDSIRAKGVWQGEIWNRRKSGEIFPEWLTVNSVADANGRVTNYVGVFSDISLHKELQLSLQRLAYYDHLTGLPNRSLFRDRLDHAVATARRDGSSFALLFIDLDNFKHINDAFGHQVGDDVLSKIGKRLQDSLRESDTGSRLGGDEFATLLLNCGTETALTKVIGNLFSRLNGHVVVEDREVFVTVSIGVARFPMDGEDADALLKVADIAMYRAKESGKERVCYYTPEMGTRLAERLAIENALRHARERGDFWLAWQPQIDLRTGSVVGAEVLIRCHCREIGDIGPAEFIPIAEESGLIAILGDWVLQQAVNEARTQLSTVLPSGARIAVNMSILQIDNDAVDGVIALAGELRKIGYKLEIELTESALMKNPVRIAAALQVIANHGIEITIDDFGTGFSNLVRLKDMPVNRLKIDQSFMRSLESGNQSARQIIKAIVALGQALNLKVLAEGVEATEQVAFLNSVGCDEAQGYLYSKPLTMEAFRQYLLAK